MSEVINIPGRLHAVDTNGIVVGANEVKDDVQNKTQGTINAETLLGFTTLHNKVYDVDDFPTTNSSKFVKSGGVKAYVDKGSLINLGIVSKSSEAEAIMASNRLTQGAQIFIYTVNGNDKNQSAICFSTSGSSTTWFQVLQLGNSSYWRLVSLDNDVYTPTAWTAINLEGVTVDNGFDSNSTNPLQNKVITNSAAVNIEYNDNTSIIALKNILGTIISSTGLSVATSTKNGLMAKTDKADFDVFKTSYINSIATEAGYDGNVGSDGIRIELKHDNNIITSVFIPNARANPSISYYRDGFMSGQDKATLDNLVSRVTALENNI